MCLLDNYIARTPTRVPKTSYRRVTAFPIYFYVTAQGAWGKALVQAIGAVDQSIHFSRVYTHSTIVLGNHRAQFAKDELAGCCLQLIQNYSENPIFDGLYTGVTRCRTVELPDGVRKVSDKPMGKQCCFCLKTSWALAAWE